MGFLTQKKVLIVGLASNRSLAYAIATALYAQGAELAFSYQNEKLRSRVETMAQEFNSHLTFPCDVANDTDIQALFEQLASHWDGLDIIIHSVAFAPASQVSGDFLANANRDGFRIAHDISSYSLIALTQMAQPMMEGRQGSILTLSYYGAEKAIPNYNMMGLAKASLESAVRYLALNLGPRGIRVNAISAGPIKTLAAAGIKDFSKMQNLYNVATPLKRNVTPAEVGNTAAFLCSDLASGITAEVVHVDAGYHAIGMYQL